MARNDTEIPLKKETIGSKEIGNILEEDMKKDSTSSNEDNLRSGKSTEDTLNEEHMPEDIPTSESEAVSGDQPEQTEPPDGGWGWVIVLGVGMALGINAGFNKSVTLFYEQVLMRFRGSAAVTAGLTSTAGTLRMVLSMFLISTLFLLHRKSPKVEVKGKCQNSPQQHDKTC